MTSHCVWLTSCSTEVGFSNACWCFMRCLALLWISCLMPYTHRRALIKTASKDSQVVTGTFWQNTQMSIVCTFNVERCNSVDGPRTDRRLITIVALSLQQVTKSQAVQFMLLSTGKCHCPFYQSVHYTRRVCWRVSVIDTPLVGLMYTIASYPQLDQLRHAGNRVLVLC